MTRGNQRDLARAKNQKKQQEVAKKKGGGDGLSLEARKHRLPQEVYQTSKIAKLRLMMEKGITKEDEDKTLNEIDIELKIWKTDELSTSETEEDQIISEPTNEEKVNNRIEDSLIIGKQYRKPQNTEITGILEYSAKECNAFKKKNYIKNKISPKKAECLEKKKTFGAI